MIKFKWDKKSEWLLGGFEYLRADDLVAGAAVGTGPTFRTDQLAGGQHVPFAKLMSGTADDSAVIPGDATNGLYVNVKAAALPSGASTEATLAAASAKLPATLGQKVMSASMAVVLASDQGNIGINDGGTSLTMDSPQLPAALVGGRLSVDGSGVTQPVSASSLPLPSGAATEATLAAASAKLPSALGQTTMAASLSVAIASNQGALPINDNGGSLTIDAASLPLPTGAATAAKQPALGTAGTPSADVITVQGAASMTALKVDGSAVTQPISGTVTANAGSGTMAVSLASVPSHAVTNAGTFATQVDGAALTALQLIDNLVLAEDAAHASADPGVQMLAVRKDTAAALAGTDGDYAPLEVDASGRLHVNVGALPASTNTIEVVGDAAHDAAIAGNPVRAAGRARTSDYTSVANDDTADFITDLNGKQIVLPYAIPENSVSGAITTAMTGTTSTSLVAAPGAGLRNYITTLIVSNSHATVGTDVVIQDGSGGTALMTIPAGALYGGAVINLPTPLRQPTANTALYCANVTTGASTKVSAVGFKAP